MTKTHGYGLSDTREQNP